MNSSLTIGSALSTPRKGASEETPSLPWTVLKRDFVFPLTHPTVHKTGEVFQLWAIPDAKVVGSVQCVDRSVRWISSDKVRNALSPHEDSTTLYNRLLSGPLRVWDYVFREGNLWVWPHLEAAGWRDALPRQNGDVSGITRLAQTRTQGEMAAWFYSNGYTVCRNNNVRVELVLNGQSAGIVDESRADDIRRFLIGQKGQQVSIRLHADPVSPSERQFAGRGLVFVHKSQEKSSNGTTFNIDLSLAKGQREEKGGFHIDVRSPYLPRDEKKISTKETYQANHEARAQGKKPPFDVQPKPATQPPREPPPPSRAGFRQTLQQTGLTASYNSTHPNNPMPGKGLTGGEIGGVACSTAFIENLFDDPSALFLDHHYFCFPKLPGGEMPFTQGELRQILRELAIGIYVHGALPFFSLHFQDEGTDLFPVIHPAYANTLVGRVIGMLDYIMKGYLNGGVYKEEFIDSWRQRPDWTTRGESAFEQLIEFTTYCKEKMSREEQPYIPLAALDEISQTALEIPEALRSFAGFKNAFRIIAKEEKIEREGPLLLFSSDFDVFCDINPTPAYRQALEEYTRQQGQPPPSHIQMESLYQLMTQRIHDHMRKMPLCQKYFSMLSIISSFSSYFSTLKQHRKEPRLPPVQRVETRGCPSLFPHLPRTQKKAIVLKHRLSDTGAVILETHRLFLTRCLNEIFDNIADERPEVFPAALQRHAFQVFEESFLNSIWDHTGFLERRMLGSKEELRELAVHLGNTLAQDFFQGWQEALLQTKRTLDQRPRLSYPGYYQIASIRDLRSELLDAHLRRLGELPNDPVDCLQLTRVLTLFPPERDSKEIRSTNGVVGGCGLEMKTQKARPSLQSRSVWQAHSHRLLRDPIPEESWDSLQQEDGAPLAIFRLSFDDLPAAVQDDFGWMEDLLVDPTEEKREGYVDVRKAIRNNDRASFSELIRGITPALRKSRDIQGRTLLHHAASCEDPFYAQELIRAGFSPTARDLQDYLPLHYAAMHSNIPVLKAVYRADLLNAEGKRKDRPLSVAILHHNEEAVNFFLSEKAAPAFLIGGYTDLHSALHEGNRAVIDLLLQSSSIHPCLNVNSFEGGTPLMLACELDDLSLVETLVGMGAVVTTERPHDGVTAAEIAIRRGATSILAYLVTQATPSFLALEAAAQEGSAEIVTVLRPHIFSFTNVSRDNAIHVALRRGNLEAALTLVNLCPDPNLLSAKNIDLDTPLLLAARLGAWTFIDALRKKGVRIEKSEIAHLLHAPYDPLLKNIVQETPLSQGELDQLILLAAQLGNHRAIAEGLATPRANLQNCRGPKGWTLPHYLAKSDGIYLFRLLMDTAPDLSRPLDQEGGLTLAGIAAQAGSRRVLEYLLHKGISPRNAHGDRHLLYLAIESGVEDLLLERCAHDVLDSKQRNAGHVAAWSGSVATLKKLSAWGLDLQRPDQDQITPLDYAVRAQAKDAIIFLLDDVHVPLTPRALYWAADRSPELLLLLTAKHPSPEMLAEAGELARQDGAKKAAAQLSGTPFLEEEIDQIDELVHALRDGQMIQAQQILSHYPTEFLFSATLLQIESLVKKGTAFQQLLLSEWRRRRDWTPNQTDRLGRSLLYRATSAQSEQLVSLLLERGADPERLDQQLCSPLAIACVKGSLSLVKRFLAAGVSPNQRVTTNRITALYLAAAAGHHPIVQYLLSHGANTDVVGSDGSHLIHMLAQEGYDLLIRLLVARGVSVDLEDAEGRNAKHHAARAGKSKTLALLVSLQKHPLSSEEGQSLLGLASVGGHDDTVRWLLQQGVVPSTEISEKGAPFTRAALGKNPSAVLPLFHPYRVSESTHSLRNAIGGAIQTDNLAAVKMLYAQGVGIDLEILAGHTGLHLASSLGAFHTTQWLLREKADPTLPCQTGETALELAAGNNSWQQFRSLLSYQQPSLNQRYLRGETLMHIAAKTGNLFHLGLLLADHAALDVKDDQGCTPFYRAAAAGKEEAIRLLLASGASPSIPSVSGQMPVSVLPEEKRFLSTLIALFTQPVAGDTHYHRAIRAQSLFALQLFLGMPDMETVNQEKYYSIFCLSTHCIIQWGNLILIGSL